MLIGNKADVLSTSLGLASGFAFTRLRWGSTLGAAGREGGLIMAPQNV
jgi:hypothetical protein